MPSFSANSTKLVLIPPRFSPSNSMYASMYSSDFAGIIYLSCHISAYNLLKKIMFGNCFFSLFSVFKNNFLFLRLKNLFGNSKLAKNKNCFQNLICEGN